MMEKPTKLCFKKWFIKIKPMKYLYILLAAIFLSGCGAMEYIENKAIDVAIKYGDITQISDYLYSGKRKKSIFSDEVINSVAKKRWEIFAVKQLKS